jgi:ABC-type bacteriocin/lantibiotic exporter with double-glycine peptidase domain
MDDIRLMPMGFATPVGSLGHHLSGGQRQRLCLARALAGDPDILILDEGTSAVDLVTERRIIASLATLSCTRVLLTHRLHIAPLADQVVLLEQGRIAAVGTHRELLGRSPAYAALWAAHEHEREQNAPSPEEPAGTELPAG